MISILRFSSKRTGKLRRGEIRFSRLNRKSRAIRIKVKNDHSERKERRRRITRRSRSRSIRTLRRRSTKRKKNTAVGGNDLIYFIIKKISLASPKTYVFTINPIFREGSLQMRVK